MRCEHSSILIMSLVVMQILKMVFDMADILLFDSVFYLIFHFYLNLVVIYIWLAENYFC